MSMRGFELNPARLVVLSFAGAILAGTFLLLIPAATAPGRTTDFVTALFTATSAVCVTGLAVVDTSSHWTPLGQAIILFLIQIGGLGIMTLSTLIFFLLGRRISLRERLVIQEALGQEALAGVVRLVRQILVMTAVIELTGALVLAVRWSLDMPAGRAMWFGLFHAVSAFNNAGFDIFGPSLTGYVGDWVVNLTIMALIVLGGLGFAVISEVVGLHRRGRRLSLHSRMVLRMTAALIAVGAVLIFALEFRNPATLGGLPWPAKGLAALFQSVAPRTAGFETVDLGRFHPITLLVVAILMFIGASPGSTGGGIKTTTFSVLALTVWTTIAGREDVEVSGRRLHWSIVNRALAIALIGFSLVLTATGVLMLLQPAPFINLMFEVTSAFGTVGLSAAPGGGTLTPHLHVWPRLVIVATMFVGRVGPLTLAYAIARRQRKRRLYRLPEDRVMVG